MVVSWSRRGFIIYVILKNLGVDIPLFVVLTMKSLFIIMRIEHIEFYDYLDTYCSSYNCNALYDMEFTSLYQVAVAVRAQLGTNDKPLFRQALVFMDNWRYLLVTPKSFDVHYHAHFSQMDSLKDSPNFNKFQ